MEFLQAIGFEATQTPTLALLSRILIAAVLGGVIGFEREVHHRGAGFRTHILVACAASLFTLLGYELFDLMQERQGVARADLIRVIEAVTAGVAFLGAGTIFVSKGSVRGLTTGAGMWLAGAVGVACGLGHYLLAGVAALIAVVALALLAPISEKIDRTIKSDAD